MIGESIERIIKLSKLLISEHISEEKAIIIVKQMDNGLENGVVHFAVNENCTPLLDLETLIIEFSKEKRFFSWQEKMQEGYCGWHFLDKGEFKNILNVVPEKISEYLFQEGYIKEKKEGSIAELEKMKMDAAILEARIKEMEASFIKEKILNPDLEAEDYILKELQLDGLRKACTDNPIPKEE